MVAVAGRASASVAGPANPWLKVVFWTLAFQLAWNWRLLAPLFADGAMPDTDDFLRLQQVRDWLAGQGWFDLIQHRFDPPLGADIHWSRLVDIPIAALIGLFGWFLDAPIAERLALAIWPTLLLVATVVVVVRTCMALVEDFNPLLAVLLTVTCLTALTEYLPGRIDHHGFQILLFCLILLGLATPAARWSGYLIGAAIAASIAVGLDAILLIVLVLAWLGLDWAAGSDRDGRRMLSVAAGLAVATPLLYVANIAPSAWLMVRCDASSLVYLCAQIAIAVGFGWLALASPMLAARNTTGTIAIRLGAGLVVGASIVAMLFLAFPQCAAGPYGEIAPALHQRWLVSVNEAMPLGERLDRFPELWVSGIGLSLFLLGIGAIVVWRRARAEPGLIGLFAVLALSVAAAAIQYRALRIGIFASIPLCVVFIGLASDWIDRRSLLPAIVGAAAKAIIVILLMPPVWWVAGLAATGWGGGSGQASDAAPGQVDAEFGQWRKTDDAPLCNRQEQYAELAALRPGLVMNDINSGPPILVFTRHSAIGGPYHRNAQAILDMLEFFESDLDTARRIADRRPFDYVYFCDTGDFTRADAEASDSLAAHVVLGTEPEWLERLTPKNGRYHLFRVRR